MAELINKKSLTFYLMYLSHPIKKNRLWNIKALKHIVKEIIIYCDNIVPIVPVLYDVFCDKNPEDSSHELKFEQAIVDLCSILVVFLYDRIGLSTEQEKEIIMAKERNISILYIRIYKKEEVFTSAFITSALSQILDFCFNIDLTKLKYERDKRLNWLN